MLNQATTIEELRKMLPGVRLMHYTHDRHEWSTQLAEHGIYNCHSCGYLQPIELTHCKKCGEEKYLFNTEEHEKRCRKRKRHQPAVIVAKYRQQPDETVDNLSHVL